MSDETEAAADFDYPKTLDEFCVGLSSVDKRVELIAGFHAHEKAAGNLKSTSAAFGERFESFANAPA